MATYEHNKTRATIYRFPCEILTAATFVEMIRKLTPERELTNTI